MPDLSLLSLLTQLLINGLLLAGIYALMAVGLNIIFGVIRILNMAHGELLMLGGFGAFWVWRLLGLNPIIAVPLLAPVFFAAGYLFQRLVLQRLVLPQAGRGMAREDSSLLLTYGLSLALVALARVLSTADYRSVPFLRGSWALGQLVVSYSQLAALTTAAVMTAALLVLLNYTSIGRAIRATAQNHDLAETCGVAVRRIYAVTLGLGAAAAAVAGVMFSMIYAIYPEMGLDYSIRAFVIVILGGLGSLVGSFAGALALGLTESFSAFYLGSLPATIVPFLLILAVLLIRPTGVAGGRKREA
jgi:branched-chain amino acid transport system permease protein